MVVPVDWDVVEVALLVVTGHADAEEVDCELEVEALELVDDVDIVSSRGQTNKSTRPRPARDAEDAVGV